MMYVAIALITLIPAGFGVGSLVVVQLNLFCLMKRVNGLYK